MRNPHDWSTAEGRLRSIAAARKRAFTLEDLPPGPWGKLTILHKTLHSLQDSRWDKYLVHMACNCRREMSRHILQRYLREKRDCVCRKCIRRWLKKHPKKLKAPPPVVDPPLDAQGAFRIWPAPKVPLSIFERFPP